MVREVHAKINIDKKSPIWKSYVDYVNEIVLEGISQAVQTALKHLNEQIVFEVLIFSRFIIDQEFFEGLLRVFKPEIAVDLEPVEVFGGLFLDVFKVVGDRRHDVFDVEVIS